jgi:imidazolonepropionase-like amidohydrolase
LVHATLIDGTGAPARTDINVIITAGRIASIGESSRTPVPMGADVLDATGKYLVPGLWDMHFHLGEFSNRRKTLGQLVADGVTGIRDMASPLDEALRARSEIRTGTLVGPRMVIAGPIIQGPLPFPMPPLVRVATDADAAKIVDDLKTAGVDFIKVGDSLTRQTYLTIAAESRRVGLPFAGHLTPYVSAIEAAQAGQRSIEHFGSAGFRNLLIASSTDEATLSAQAQAALDRLRSHGEFPDAALYRADYTNRLVDTYDVEKAKKLFALFVSKGTWLVPTFSVLNEAWSAQRAKLNASDAAAADRVSQKTYEMFKDARKVGVRVLAGTDLPIRDGVAPLHEELRALVRAGMSEMDVLRTATHDSAEFLNLLDATGTVEVGKDADILILDANPLSDIRNTRQISSVILRGKLFRKDDLQSLSAK